jgi:molybdenum cofactor biosynthesis enzyme MoaA
MDKRRGIMYEMKSGKLNSLSIFVGTSECNGRCSHCAGRPLREYAPKEDGVIDEDLIYKTIRECYKKGARTLSISSSGEPTLSPKSVTKTLRLVYRCGDEGIIFRRINLYTNGIRIGEDESFSKEYLPLWRSYGLTTAYVTVHHIDEKKNAIIYGIKNYPSLEKVLQRIHDSELLMRANLVLTKELNGTFEDFTKTLKHLIKMGVDYISAWPIRTLDDRVDIERAPLNEELDKIEKWIEEQKNSEIRLLREKSRVAYQSGQKLTLFPDGTLSNTWCN